MFCRETELDTERKRKIEREMTSEKLWWAWGALARGTASTNVTGDSLLQLLTVSASMWNDSALREAINTSGNATWPGDDYGMEVVPTGSLTNQEYGLIVSIVVATTLGFLILATIIGELEEFLPVIFIVISVPCDQ